MRCTLAARRVLPLAPLEAPPLAPLWGDALSDDWSRAYIDGPQSVGFGSVCGNVVVGGSSLGILACGSSRTRLKTEDAFILSMDIAGMGLLIASDTTGVVTHLLPPSSLLVLPD
jgi:hypothetical protein